MDDVHKIFVVGKGVNLLGWLVIRALFYETRLKLGNGISFGIAVKELEIESDTFLPQVD